MLCPAPKTNAEQITLTAPARSLALDSFSMVVVTSDFIGALTRYYSTLRKGLHSQQSANQLIATKDTKDIKDTKDTKDTKDIKDIKDIKGPRTKHEVTDLVQLRVFVSLWRIPVQLLTKSVLRRRVRL